MVQLPLISQGKMPVAQQWHDLLNANLLINQHHDFPVQIHQ
jgi:hypothetical protein